MVELLQQLEPLDSVALQVDFVSSSWQLPRLFRYNGNPGDNFIIN